MEIALIKHSIITIGKVLVIVLALLYIISKFGGCKDKIIVDQIDNSSLIAKMKSDSLLIVKFKEKRTLDSIAIVESKHKEDSLKKVKDKYAYLYHNACKVVYDQIHAGICDTVSVKLAIKQCDSVIVSFNGLVAQKDTTIKRLEVEVYNVKQENIVLKDMVSSAQTIIKNQAEDYKTLEKESKKALRKQKVKTVGVIILATLTEALTIFALK